MAYFAQLDASNIVTQVIAVSDEHCADPAPDNEQDGIAYLTALGLGDNWIQTSFNSNFRKQFAGIGYTYDADADVFISPQPYPSWSLDSHYEWQPPTPYPSAGKWQWNEESMSWVELVVGLSSHP